MPEKAPKFKPDMMWVADLLDRANDLLDDRHSSIGPSHFLRLDLSEEWVELIWEHSILPYLAEQFFGEEDRLSDFAISTLRGAEPEQEVEESVSEENIAMEDEDAAPDIK